MSEHDPRTTPQGSLLDNIQTAAWRGLVDYLIGEPWAQQQFTADTGIAVPSARPRSPLDAAIDQACGFDPNAKMEAFVVAFTRWATEAHWGGEAEITPTIRGILDSLPKASAAA
jgi:hypothetical protein